MGNLERDFGNMEARMDNIEKQLADIQHDMKEVKDMVTKFKGGFVVLMFIGSLVGSVGFTWALKILSFIPR